MRLVPTRIIVKLENRGLTPASASFTGIGIRASNVLFLLVGVSGTLFASVVADMDVRERHIDD